MIQVPENTPAELIKLINWIDIDKIPLNQQVKKLNELENVLVKFKIPVRKKPYAKRPEQINIPDRLMFLIEKYDVTAHLGYKIFKTQVLKQIQNYIYQNLPTKG